MNDELKAAATRIIDRKRDYWTKHDHDEYTVAVALRSRFAADEAARIEREKRLIILRREIRSALSDFLDEDSIDYEVDVDSLTGRIMGSVLAAVVEAKQ
jgi:hypothetical protein